MRQCCYLDLITITEGTLSQFGSSSHSIKPLFRENTLLVLFSLLTSYWSLKPMLVFAAAILAALLIFWEYLNGGVVTHYPLADADNPGTSNWWGLLTFPLLTWAALIIAEK